MIAKDWLGRRLRRSLLHWRIRKALPALKGAGPAAQALWKALRDVASDATTPEELQVLRRVEALHAELSDSDEEIHWWMFDSGPRWPEFEARRLAMSPTSSVRVDRLGRVASVPDHWGRVLFRLVREHRPAVCLELGTCIGVSAAFQAAALRLNGSGRLVSLEGGEQSAALARRNLESLELHNVQVVVGLFDDTLPEVLPEIAPVDMAYIDGHHDDEPTRAYVDRIHAFLSPGALLVLDDIDWSRGMAVAWSHVRRDPRVLVSADLGRMGICLVGADAP